MENLVGHKGEKALSDIGFGKRIVSMGHQACGALELWNYPLWLRDLIPQNTDGTDRLIMWTYQLLKVIYIYTSADDLNRSFHEVIDSSWQAR